MNKNRPGIGQIFVMVAFAASCFGLLLFLWSSFGGPVPLRGKEYQVSTTFTQDSQLATYADVRVSGVTVGKVLTIVRTPKGTKVTMKIDPKYVPLPTDTRATLRTKTLLGETFVDLSFGSRRDAIARRAYIPENGQIPSRQVQSTVELNEIFDAFDPRTRADLRRLITSLAEATKGRGQDLNQAIAQVGPTLESTDTLVNVLDRQSAEIQSGTRALGQTLSAVGRRAGAIAVLTRSGRQLLETTAGTTVPLRETLRILPTTLEETRKTLVVARATAGDAKPTLAILRPVTPLIRPALQQLAVLAPELQQTLIELRPVLGKVRTGLPALRRILEAVGPTADSLVPVASDLLPLAQYLHAYRREIPVTFANSAAALQATSPDAHGVQRSYLRVALPINGESLSGADKRLPTNRYSPYPNPGDLDFGGTGRAPSFSCDNLGNPSGLLTGLLDIGGNQPCIAQPPFPFDGTTSLFTRIAPTPPPAVASARGRGRHGAGTR